MTGTIIDHTDRILARQYSLQFLYQCEIDQVFYFSMDKFQEFFRHFEMKTESHDFSHQLTKSCMDIMSSIDEKISQASQNWSLSRMGIIDRSILRLAITEQLLGLTPAKVIINEYIELAKKFGTKDSPAFVNGILDQVIVK